MTASRARSVFLGSLPVLALVVGVVAFPLVFRNHYVQSVGATIGLYSLVALGLCLLIGYAGQVSLGHAAFFGLGAYSSAILTTRFHWDPWLALLAGVLLTGTVAWAVGRPTLRLHGHHLAMATLGFGIIMQIVFIEGDELTGGFGGITSIPPLHVGGLSITGDLRNFYAIWAVVVLCVMASRCLVDSRVGRALRAIHDSETAAAACGVDVATYKVQVFVLSAVFASVAGSLYAHYITFVSPDPFSLAFSIQMLVIVIVGGSRNVWGALLGAALMTALAQQIEKTDAIKDLSDVAYGLMLVLFIVFMPAGLAGVLSKGLVRVRTQRADEHV